MSTAEAVSVYFQTLSHAWYFGNGSPDPEILVENLIGAVCKENKDDLPKLRNYFRTASKEKGRSSGIWKEYLASAKLMK